jgi:hypothetical protein
MSWSQASSRNVRFEKALNRIGPNVTIRVRLQEYRTRKQRRRHRLDTETIEGATAALKRINDIEGSNGFPLCVFSISHGVADNLKSRLKPYNTESMITYTLKEVLQHSTGFFIDEARDTLDTTTTSEAADSRLGNTLNVVTQDFTMPLSTGLSETLATLSTASYEAYVRKNNLIKRLYTDTLLDYWVKRKVPMGVIYGEPKLLLKCAEEVGDELKEDMKARLYGGTCLRRTRRSLNLVCHVPARLANLAYFEALRF